MPMITNCDGLRQRILEIRGKRWEKASQQLWHMTWHTSLVDVGWEEKLPKPGQSARTHTYTREAGDDKTTSRKRSHSKTWLEREARACTSPSQSLMGNTPALDIAFGIQTPECITPWRYSHAGVAPRDPGGREKVCVPQWALETRHWDMPLTRSTSCLHWTSRAFCAYSHNHRISGSRPDFLLSGSMSPPKKWTRMLAVYIKNERDSWKRAGGKTENLEQKILERYRTCLWGLTQWCAYHRLGCGLRMLLLSLCGEWHAVGQKFKKRRLKKKNNSLCWDIYPNECSRFWHITLSILTWKFVIFYIFLSHRHQRQLAWKMIKPQVGQAVYLTSAGSQQSGARRRVLLPPWPLACPHHRLGFTHMCFVLRDLSSWVALHWSFRPWRTLEGILQWWGWSEQLMPQWSKTRRLTVLCCPIISLWSLKYDGERLLLIFLFSVGFVMRGTSGSRDPCWFSNWNSIAHRPVSLAHTWSLSPTLNTQVLIPSFA